MIEVDQIVSKGRPGAPGQPLRHSRRSSATGQVAIRIWENTLMFFDPDTRELLRIRANPLPWE